MNAVLARTLLFFIEGASPDFEDDDQNVPLDVRNLHSIAGEYGPDAEITWRR